MPEQPARAFVIASTADSEHKKCCPSPLDAEIPNFFRNVVSVPGSYNFNEFRERELERADVRNPTLLCGNRNKDRYGYL